MDGWEVFVLAREGEGSEEKGHLGEGGEVVWVSRL